MPKIRQILSIILITAFISTFIAMPRVHAGEMVVPVMPAPGTMVALSAAFAPAHLQGIVIHPNNALQFDFLINKGDGNLNPEEKSLEYNKLIKYFLAALTVPDNDQWVNLSPYEKSRVIQDDFGKTEMGRDLLGQDYLLKQITSSLMYPESGLGKNFWNQVYEKAYKELGNTNIPVNTFNKVWIVPSEAVIHENGNIAFIVKSHLKVLLETDYLAQQKAEVSKSILRSQERKHLDEAGLPQNEITKKVIRDIILPALEKEVNEGKNFAQLRQVFSGMILATWYKKALKESLLGKVYADKVKVRGVDLKSSPNVLIGDPESIYQQYLQAFKKGVFNYIKDTGLPAGQAGSPNGVSVPRKYFAGGFAGHNEKMINRAMVGDGQLKLDFAQAGVDRLDAAMAELNPENGVIMSNSFMTIPNAMIPDEVIDVREMGDDTDWMIKVVDRNKIMGKTDVIAALKRIKPHIITDIRYDPDRTFVDINKFIRRIKTPAYDDKRTWVFFLTRNGHTIEAIVDVKSDEAMNAGQIHFENFYSFERIAKLPKTRNALNVESFSDDDIALKLAIFRAAFEIDPNGFNALMNLINNSEDSWDEPNFEHGLFSLKGKNSIALETLLSADLEHEDFVQNYYFAKIVLENFNKNQAMGSLPIRRMFILAIAGALLTRDTKAQGSIFLPTVRPENQKQAPKETFDVVGKVPEFLNADWTPKIKPEQLSKAQVDILDDIARGFNFYSGKVIFKGDVDILEWLKKLKAFQDFLIKFDDAILKISPDKLEMRYQMSRWTADLNATLENLLDREFTRLGFNEREAKQRLTKGAKITGFLAVLQQIEKIEEEIKGIKRLVLTNEGFKRNETALGYKLAIVRARVNQEIKGLLGNNAMATPNDLGGIDMNAANMDLVIKRDGKGVPLPLAQQDLAQLSRIKGFTPHIIEIRPLSTWLYKTGTH